ncbi:hypothetical protein LMG23992_00150 [Cupriavidus laharis]|uniref:Phospholipase D-like domain-containing protein n=1 Tax=Cupriavidus laharis TaxID=151654 RepID=A0ABM8WCI8_9BURK|nr:phospholipase D family protein [Cupriavidus laharis]CAG9165004.1 hypothetical protein LMG23992_00150 [Cupriavidus laharis]
MKLIHGKDIQLALREVRPESIAVAYVGADWAQFIDSSMLREIVLSPTLGTNPTAVAEVAAHVGWENVHFLDNLHAKFYIGKESAAVGSFNLTANGLSAEGLEEAGFLVHERHTVDELHNVMESYKRQAMLAYSTVASKLARLSELRAMWDRAIKNRVIRADARDVDFGSYEFLAADEIYVCPLWGSVTYSEQIVSESVIEDCISFLESDKVSPDRWILCWHTRRDGFPDERHRPYWLHIDEIVPHGAVDTVYTKLAIQRTDRAPLPPPFDLTDAVVSALRSVLKSDRFPPLRGNVDPWSLNATLPYLQEFFVAMRSQLGGNPKSDNRLPRTR